MIADIIISMGAPGRGAPGVREMGCTDDARRIHDTMLSGEYVARYL